MKELSKHDKHPDDTNGRDSFISNPKIKGRNVERRDEKFLLMIVNAKSIKCILLNIFYNNKYLFILLIIIFAIILIIIVVIIIIIVNINLLITIVYY